MIMTESLHIKRGVYTIKQEFAPSQLYHSFIFGVMFYLVVSILPVIIISRVPIWATIAALVSLAGYALTAAVDASPLVPKTPEPVR